jgi:hypothetical protein
MSPSNANIREYATPELLAKISGRLKAIDVSDIPRSPQRPLATNVGKNITIFCGSVINARICLRTKEGAPGTRRYWDAITFLNQARLESFLLISLARATSRFFGDGRRE